MNRRQLLLRVLATATPPLSLAACGKPKPSALPPLNPAARVLALGDSLTAGYGATADEAWPMQLAQLTGWQVDNHGINGDTSAGALERLDALFAAESYDAVLIAIGGNDMLRGMSPASTKNNLAAIVRKALARTPYVALIATPAPEALRAAVGALKDAEMYQEVASAEKVLLIPQVYAGVLSDAALRSDPIHANARGYALIAQQLEERLAAAGWR